jgi:hypothetical protein
MAEARNSLEGVARIAIIRSPHTTDALSFLKELATPATSFGFAILLMSRM